jgi:hypothetical protein
VSRVEHKSYDRNLKPPAEGGASRQGISIHIGAPSPRVSLFGGTGHIPVKVLKGDHFDPTAPKTDGLLFFCHHVIGEFVGITGRNGKMPGE